MTKVQALIIGGGAMGAGLAYFLASRTLANSGQVFALEPALVGLAPSAALAIATASCIATRFGA